VVPEVTGLLIPPGYPDAIAEAVLRLIRNPGERARMGSAARAWIMQRFVNERVLRLTVAFYQNLLATADAEVVTGFATDPAAVGD
jgi:glycosyltransferase involved in cell wall biosynthesis